MRLHDACAHVLQGNQFVFSEGVIRKTQKHHVWLRCWDHGLTAPGRRLQKDHPPIRSNSTRVLQVAKAILDAAGAWAPLIQSLCILRGLS